MAGESELRGTLDEWSQQVSLREHTSKDQRELRESACAKALGQEEPGIDWVEHSRKLWRICRERATQQPWDVTL